MIPAAPGTYLYQVWKSALHALAVHRAGIPFYPNRKRIARCPQCEMFGHESPDPLAASVNHSFRPGDVVCLGCRWSNFLSRRRREDPGAETVSFPAFVLMYYAQEGFDRP